MRINSKPLNVGQINSGDLPDDVIGMGSGPVVVIRQQVLNSAAASTPVIVLRQVVELNDSVPKTGLIIFRQKVITTVAANQPVITLRQRVFNE